MLPSFQGTSYKRLN
ncbi:hypothetical protein ACHAW6_011384 [Cyclotella cf. meneghiniana]